MDAYRRTFPATIANGSALSDSVDLFGEAVSGNSMHASTPVGIQMPAVWTTANLTFQGSSDNVTFGDVYDENGSEVVITAAASRFITLPPRLMVGPRYLKVRSGTAAVPVSQAGLRVLGLVARTAF